DCGEFVGGGTFVSSLDPVRAGVVLGLERRDRGEVGEGLDGELLLLAPRYRELRGEALGKVRECGDANAADRLAPVGHGGVGRQLHAPSGPVRVILSPQIGRASCRERGYV